MKIWPLGAGGWIPAFGRQTTSFLIEHKGKLIMIDAGTGVCNLSGHLDVLSKYDSINLILTHYHLDHIAGLFYLPKYLESHRLTIWGPGKPYYEKSCEENIKGFLTQPIVTTGCETLAKEVFLKDYDPSGFNIGDVKIGIHEQEHTLPSFGISIDDLLHIATDTKPNLEHFKVPYKIIFHECWTNKIENEGKHSSVEELLNVYDISGSIAKIGLIHRNPEFSDDQYEDWIRFPFFIVHENKLIEIPE